MTSITASQQFSKSFLVAFESNLTLCIYVWCQKSFYDCIIIVFYTWYAISHTYNKTDYAYQLYLEFQTVNIL